MPNTREGREALKQLQVSVNHVIKGGIALGIVVGLLAFGSVWFGVNAYNDAQDVQTAVCTFREDLQSRLDQTRDYLNKNPEGFPGISDEQITQSLRNQQATIDSLKFLECEPSNRPKEKAAVNFTPAALRAVVAEEEVELLTSNVVPVAQGGGGTSAQNRASPDTGRRGSGRAAASEREAARAAIAALTIAAAATDAATGP